MPSESIEQRGAISALMILGPSGVAKSDFGEWLAKERNWLHLEIDRYPEGDGIDLNGLRSEWDDFYNRQDGEGLRRAIRKRLKETRNPRCVLTFPGTLILSPNHLTAASSVGIETVYLYGSAGDCITAFLDREQRTNRNLGLDHWINNNRDSYFRMSEPILARHRIHVFTHKGTRRSHSEVLEQLLHPDGPVARTQLRPRVPG